LWCSDNGKRAKPVEQEQAFPSERQPRVGLVQTRNNALTPVKFLAPEQSGCTEMEQEVYTDGVLDEFLTKCELQKGCGSLGEENELMLYHGR